MTAEVLLVWPPLWYYSAVPVELTLPLGWLRERGVDAVALDLNARSLRALFGALPAWSRLRDPAAYAHPHALDDATRAIGAHGAALSARFRARVAFRHLGFPDIDEADVVRAERVGTDPARNPALPVLARAAADIARRPPAVVGIGLGYPGQRVPLVAFARLLRTAGYRGRVVLFGGLSDQLAPIDLAPDLAGDPPHALFSTVDGALTGDAGPGLLGVLREWPEVPGLVRPGEPHPDPPPPGPLEHLPAFDGIDPLDAPYPTPLVDLRLSRGCPWARCTFCAIHAHQPHYRVAAVAELAEAARRAHAALGATWFRLRDDLLTPGQLVEVGDALGALPIRPRWQARARIQVGLTAEVLQRAAAGGLGELWLGLESASPRVRDAMDKGVDDAVVERVLDAARAARVRVRLLCMLGYPGESEAEARATLAFLLRRADLASVSLTPFQLMRRARLLDDPDRHGIVRELDPLPRRVRLRHTVPARWPGLSAEAIASIASDFQRALGPRLAAAACPDLAHGWMRASTSILR